MIFMDRRHAGRILAKAITASTDWLDPIVLGLPRGGVPVAYEVAQALTLPLDIFIVRKLGVPGQEQLAMGAIASGGLVVVNEPILNAFHISREVLEAVIRRESLEIKRQNADYRAGHPLPLLAGRTLILVDDGLATGSTMRAAVWTLRPQAKQVIVAVPIAAEETCNDFRTEVDQIVCPSTSQTLSSVGAFYQDFEQTTDDEVRYLLSLARPTPFLKAG